MAKEMPDQDHKLILSEINLCTVKLKGLKKLADNNAISIALYISLSNHWKDELKLLKQHIEFLKDDDGGW